MKRKKIFYFWAAASLILMALIFWFSSRNADESGEMSGSLARRLFEPLLYWVGADTVEVIVRKFAHFLIFSALGFCVTNAVRYIINDTKLIFLISLSWCSFYGATDEWHQYFVPGRACMWQDWLIDTSGVLIGVGASLLIFGILYNKRKNKRRGLC